MNLKKWTAEEDEYILLNHKKLSYKTIAGHCGCSIVAVQNRAEKLGLNVERKTVARWTPEEEQLLREYADIYITREIADKLNKSVLAVQKKAIKLGIVLNGEKDPFEDWMIEYLKENINKKPIGEIEEKLDISYRRILTKCKNLGLNYIETSWTEEEINTLKKYAQECHYTELTKVLPNRSIGAIGAKAFELGIETISLYTKLKDEDITFIKDNWGKLSATEIARALHITIGILNRYKKELGLPNLGQKKKWTPEVIEKLKKDAKVLDRVGLAKRYKTSVAQISAVARKHNIELKNSRNILDDELIRSIINYAKADMTTNEIADALPGITTATIRSVLYNAGIKAKTHEYQKIVIWTKEEDEKLIEMITTHSSFEIAEKLQRSEAAVKERAKKLGYNLNKRRSWTKEEEALLSELWGNYSIDYIADKLKRSVSSITNKAYLLQLGSQMENNFKGLRISEIEEIFLVHREIILTTWVALGLKVNFQKRSNQSKYAYVTIENLLAFLEMHQNIWDSRLLEEDLLGLEPDWLIEKRKSDNQLPKNVIINVRSLNKQQLLLANKYYLDMKKVQLSEKDTYQRVRKKEDKNDKKY